MPDEDSLGRSTLPLTFMPSPRPIILPRSPPAAVAVPRAVIFSLCPYAAASHLRLIHLTSKART